MTGILSARADNVRCLLNARAPADLEKTSPKGLAFCRHIGLETRHETGRHHVSVERLCHFYRGVAALLSFFAGQASYAMGGYYCASIDHLRAGPCVGKHAAGIVQLPR
jgi:hypothetical protein